MRSIQMLCVLQRVSFGQLGDVTVALGMRQSIEGLVSVVPIIILMHEPTVRAVLHTHNALSSTAW